MKKKSFTFMSVILLTFCTIIVLCAQSNNTMARKITQEKGKKLENTNIVTKNNSKIDEKMRNPFAYAIDKGAAYMSTVEGRLPLGIKIVGIITVEKNKRKAVIKIPGYKHSFFVKVGDVVRLEYYSEDRKRIDIYMEIKEIQDNIIMVSQKRYPDDVIVIQ